MSNFFARFGRKDRNHGNSTTPERNEEYASDVKRKQLDLLGGLHELIKAVKASIGSASNFGIGEHTLEDDLRSLIADLIHLSYNESSNFQGLVGEESTRILPLHDLYSKSCSGGVTFGLTSGSSVLIASIRGDLGRVESFGPLTCFLNKILAFLLASVHDTENHKEDPQIVRETLVLLCNAVTVACRNDHQQQSGLLPRFQLLIVAFLQACTDSCLHDIWAAMIETNFWQLLLGAQFFCGRASDEECLRTYSGDYQGGLQLTWKKGKLLLSPRVLIKRTTHEHHTSSTIHQRESSESVTNDNAARRRSSKYWLVLRDSILELAHTLVVGVVEKEEHELQREARPNNDTPNRHSQLQQHCDCVISLLAATTISLSDLDYSANYQLIQWFRQVYRDIQTVSRKEASYFVQSSFGFVAACLRRVTIREESLSSGAGRTNITTHDHDDSSKSSPESGCEELVSDTFTSADAEIFFLMLSKRSLLMLLNDFVSECAAVDCWHVFVREFDINVAAGDDFAASVSQKDDRDLLAIITTATTAVGVASSVCQIPAFELCATIVRTCATVIARLSQSFGGGGADDYSTTRPSAARSVIGVSGGAVVCSERNGIAMMGKGEESSVINNTINGSRCSLILGVILRHLINPLNPSARQPAEPQCTFTQSIYAYRALIAVFSSKLSLSQRVELQAYILHIEGLTLIRQHLAIKVYGAVAYDTMMLRMIRGRKSSQYAEGEHAAVACNCNDSISAQLILLFYGMEAMRVISSRNITLLQQICDMLAPPRPSPPLQQQQFLSESAAVDSTCSSGSNCVVHTLQEIVLSIGEEFPSSPSKSKLLLEGLLYFACDEPLLSLIDDHTAAVVNSSMLGGCCSGESRSEQSAGPGDFTTDHRLGGDMIRNQADHPHYPHKAHDQEQDHHHHYPDQSHLEIVNANMLKWIVTLLPHYSGDVQLFALQFIAALLDGQRSAWNKAALAVDTPSSSRTGKSSVGTNTSTDDSFFSVLFDVALRLGTSHNGSSSDSSSNHSIQQTAIQVLGKLGSQSLGVSDLKALLRKLNTPLSDESFLIMKVLQQLLLRDDDDSNSDTKMTSTSSLFVVSCKSGGGLMLPPFARWPTGSTNAFSIAMWVKVEAPLYHATGVGNGNAATNTANCSCSSGDHGEHMLHIMAVDGAKNEALRAYLTPNDDTDTDDGGCCLCITYVNERGKRYALRSEDVSRDINNNSNNISTPSSPVTNTTSAAGAVTYDDWHLIAISFSGDASSGIIRRDAGSGTLVASVDGRTILRSLHFPYPALTGPVIGAHAGLFKLPERSTDAEEVNAPNRRSTLDPAEIFSDRGGRGEDDANDERKHCCCCSGGVFSSFAMFSGCLSEDQIRFLYDLGPGHSGSFELGDLSTDTGSMGENKPRLGVLPANSSNRAAAMSKHSIGYELDAMVVLSYHAAAVRRSPSQSSIIENQSLIERGDVLSAEMLQEFGFRDNIERGGTALKAHARLVTGTLISKQRSILAALRALGGVDLFLPLLYNVVASDGDAGGGDASLEHLSASDSEPDDHHRRAEAIVLVLKLIGTMIRASGGTEGDNNDKRNNSTDSNRVIGAAVAGSISYILTTTEIKHPSRLITERAIESLFEIPEAAVAWNDDANTNPGTQFQFRFMRDVLCNFRFIRSLSYKTQLFVIKKLCDSLKPRSSSPASPVARTTSTLLPLPPRELLQWILLMYDPGEDQSRSRGGAESDSSHRSRGGAESDSSSRFVAPAADASSSELTSEQSAEIRRELYSLYRQLIILRGGVLPEDVTCLVMFLMMAPSSEMKLEALGEISLLLGTESDFTGTAYALLGVSLESNASALVSLLQSRDTQISATVFKLCCKVLTLATMVKHFPEVPQESELYAQQTEHEEDDDDDSCDSHHSSTKGLRSLIVKGLSDALRNHLVDKWRDSSYSEEAVLHTLLLTVFGEGSASSNSSCVGDAGGVSTSTDAADDDGISLLHAINDPENSCSLHIPELVPVLFRFLSCCIIDREVLIRIVRAVHDAIPPVAASATNNAVAEAILQQPDWRGAIFGLIDTLLLLAQRSSEAGMTATLTALLRDPAYESSPSSQQLLPSLELLLGVLDSLHSYALSHGVTLPRKRKQGEDKEDGDDGEYVLLTSMRGGEGFPGGISPRAAAIAMRAVGSTDCIHHPAGERQEGVVVVSDTLRALSYPWPPPPPPAPPPHGTCSKVVGIVLRVRALRHCMKAFADITMKDHVNNVNNNALARDDRPFNRGHDNDEEEEEGGIVSSSCMGTSISTSAGASICGINCMAISTVSSEKSFTSSFAKSDDSFLRNVHVIAVELLRLVRDTAALFKSVHRSSSSPPSASPPSNADADTDTDQDDLVLMHGIAAELWSMIQFLLRLIARFFGSFIIWIEIENEMRSSTQSSSSSAGISKAERTRTVVGAGEEFEEYISTRWLLARAVLGLISLSCDLEDDVAVESTSSSLDVDSMLSVLRSILIQSRASSSNSNSECRLLVLSSLAELLSLLESPQASAEWSREYESMLALIVELAMDEHDILSRLSPAAHITDFNETVDGAHNIDDAVMQFLPGDYSGTSPRRSYAGRESPAPIVCEILSSIRHHVAGEPPSSLSAGSILEYVNRVSATSRQSSPLRAGAYTSTCAGTEASAHNEWIQDSCWGSIAEALRRASREMEERVCTTVNDVAAAATASDAAADLRSSMPTSAMEVQQGAAASKLINTGRSINREFIKSLQNIDNENASSWGKVAQACTNTGERSLWTLVTSSPSNNNKDVFWMLDPVENNAGVRYRLVRNRNGTRHQVAAQLSSTGRSRTVSRKSDGIITSGVSSAKTRSSSSKKGGIAVDTVVGGSGLLGKLNKFSTIHTDDKEEQEHPDHCDDSDDDYDQGKGLEFDEHTPLPPEVVSEVVYNFNKVSNSSSNSGGLIQPQSSVLFRAPVEVITVASNASGGKTSGEIILTKRHLSFIPGAHVRSEPPARSKSFVWIADMISTPVRSFNRRQSETDTPVLSPNSVKDSSLSIKSPIQQLQSPTPTAPEELSNPEFLWALEGYPQTTWATEEIVNFYCRRYLQQSTAVEVFFSSRTSVFLNFSDEKKSLMFFRYLHRKVSLPHSIALPYRRQRDLLKYTMHEPSALHITEAWVRREISNFDYLMQLNTIAGRSFNDLGQYPVFPWVLSDYSSKRLDLCEPSSYRDLRYPIGAQRDDQREACMQRYEECLEMFDPASGVGVPPFHHGSHYSCMGFVILYLMRLEPFTSLHVWLQEGKFDRPDRMFTSIESAWQGCATNSNDVKELIPEFFFCPEFLQNCNNIEFGTTQDGAKVDAVELPPWCGSGTGTPVTGKGGDNNAALDFIRINREALESEYVSQNLHHWVDLIFGYKQRPPQLVGGSEAAVEAVNVFFHLTYPDAVDIKKIRDSDPVLYEQTVNQFDSYGQTPAQLFNAPHPQRHSLSEADVIWPMASSVLGADTQPRKGRVPLDKPKTVISFEKVSVSFLPVTLLALDAAHDKLITVDDTYTAIAHQFEVRSPDVVPPYHFRVNPIAASRIARGRSKTKGGGSVTLSGSIQSAIKKVVSSLPQSISPAPVPSVYSSNTIAGDRARLLQRAGFFQADIIDTNQHQSVLTGSYSSSLIATHENAIAYEREEKARSETKNQNQKPRQRQRQPHARTRNEYDAEQLPLINAWNAPPVDHLPNHHSVEESGGDIVANPSAVANASSDMPTLKLDSPTSGDAFLSTGNSSEAVSPLTTTTALLSPLITAGIRTGEFTPLTSAGVRTGEFTPLTSAGVRTGAFTPNSDTSLFSTLGSFTPGARRRVDVTVDGIGKQRGSSERASQHPYAGSEQKNTGNGVAILTDCALLLTTGYTDNSFRVSSLDNSKLLQSVYHHVDTVTCIATSSDYGQHWVATGSRDCTAAVWRVQPISNVPGTTGTGTGVPLYTIDSSAPVYVLRCHDDTVNCISMNGELDIIATGSDDCTVNIYALRSGAFLRSFTLGANMFFSPPPPPSPLTSPPPSQPIYSSKASTAAAGGGGSGLGVTSAAAAAAVGLLVSESPVSNSPSSKNGSVHATMKVVTKKSGDVEVEAPRRHRVHLLCLTKEAYVVAYSHDGWMLFSYTVNGQYVRGACIHEKINVMIPSEDGKVVITGGERCLVVLRWVHTLTLANNGARRGLTAVIDGYAERSAADSSAGAASGSVSSTPRGTTTGNKWRLFGSNNSPSESASESAKGNNSSCFASPIRSLLLTEAERHLIVGLESGEIHLLAQESEYLRDRLHKKLVDIGLLPWAI